MKLLALAALVLLSAAAMAANPWPTLTGAPPLVIAHRGASGDRPEHTLAAYRLAIAQGADFIEPDLVMTRDGALVARHDALLAQVELDPDGSIRRVDGQVVLHRSNSTTNVWRLPRYADRMRMQWLDGERVAGWFAEDFTAAEIRRDIRAEERLRDLRPGNRVYDGLFPIPTLDEIVALAQAESAARGRTIGLYPETKHPTHYAAHARARGLPRMEDRLLQVLHRHYGNRAAAPVFIQSFEVANLAYLRARTRLRLVQLLDASGQPYDLAATGDPRRYADLASPEGLAAIRRYADAVGVHKALLIPLVNGNLGAPTRLVADAHRLGLAVHAWTFRAENAFLPGAWRRGSAPGARGDLGAELAAYLGLGLDGFFTDQPDLGVAAVRAWRWRVRQP